MVIIDISGSPLQCGDTDRLMHSLLGLSRLVQSLKRRRAALPMTGLVIFLLACAWAYAEEQSSRATPASSKAPAASEKPRYLVFWYSPEKVGQLVEQIGMKGDG